MSPQAALLLVRIGAHCVASANLPGTDAPELVAVARSIARGLKENKQPIAYAILAKKIVEEGHAL